MAASLRPRRGFLFPGLLIVAGVTLLIAMLGGLPEGYWGALLPLWPVAVIAIGISLLLARIRPWIGSTVGLGLIAGALVAAWPLAAFDYFEGHFGSVTSVHEFSVERREARSARVELEVGAAKLELGAGAAPGVLTNGTFEGCGIDSLLEVDVRQADDHRTVRLSSENDPGVFRFECGSEWDVALSPLVPTSLKLAGGLWDAALDLEDLQITKLDVETGASETEVTLPRAAGHMSANFDIGAGNLEIYVPEGVAIRIDIEGGAVSFDLDAKWFGERRRSTGLGVDELYVSPDFATAKNRVDIKIRAGASEISVKSIP